MKRRRELTAELGQRFGWLKVIAFLDPVHRKPRVRLRCRCGKEVDRFLIDLYQPTSTVRSCGCAKSGLAGGFNKTPYAEEGILSPELQAFYLGML